MSKSSPGSHTIALTPAPVSPSAAFSGCQRPYGVGVTGALARSTLDIVPCSSRSDRAIVPPAGGCGRPRPPGTVAAMTRRYAWPEGHWAWPIPVTHKHGVRSGDLCFVGGQVDLAPTGEVLHAGDIAAQAPAAMASMGRVLRDLDAGLGD